ncbi:cytochrome c oxidase assembly factor 7 homolog isoform X1 [Colletes gigas]|uniref:cytochrome c oxidase assembly factor 7 homolog isoform X1 n=1 Tax=Colletes gigas TaxID=935657 RepID=UPI001C9AD15E|nr:cytochrome c oxidase assembly factor 7 homolog isoform X1 [Colletes gigas]
MAYNLKDAEEVKEYLKNLYIEYQFGCYSEKNPEVCHLLGDYNESIKTDNKEAADIYKKTCDDMNYARSCTKYGDFALVGKGCEKNVKEAYKYLKKGCDLDDTKGCYHAGVFAVTSEELEKDRAVQVADGVRMLKKSCDLGEEKACFHLSSIYLNGIKGHVDKNTREAYKLSLKCCEMGNPYACSNIAIMHKQGDGVQKNKDLATVFQQRAELLFNELKKYKKQIKFHQGIDL